MNFGSARRDLHPMVVVSTNVTSDFTSPASPSQTEVDTVPSHASWQVSNLPTWRSASSTNTNMSSEQRDWQFGELISAIKAMSALPKNDSFHIDAETARRSYLLLSALLHRPVEAPQLFPQDGEALNFTWDVGAIRKYLTIAADEFSELDLNRNNFIRCEQDLPDFATSEFSAWLRAFAGEPRSSTTTVE